MKKTILILLVATMIGMTSTASAQKGKHDRHYDHNNSFTDYAIVTHVSPVYERRSQCRDHDDSHSSYYNDNRKHKKEHKKNTRHSPGNFKGKAQNRHFSISIDFDNFPLPHHRPQQQRRCKTGYNVTYRYNGHNYTTFMKHRPEHRIRLQVSIQPVNAW